MKIIFLKYEGTGNDFIIIDNRKSALKLNNHALWKRLCNRRFGIGADGLILLRNKRGYDFEMYYVNADGKPTSMCGNGGRCIAHFAKSLGIIRNSARFLAIDGAHEAIINGDTVKLKMNDVEEIIKIRTPGGAAAYVLDTGSPHYITMVADVSSIDVNKAGKAIRNSKNYIKEGINVNFVEAKPNKIPILRTYERGVEAETLSCGTGTVATALTLALLNNTSATDHCVIKTKGGNLKVWFTRRGKRFTNIWLEGPATPVFKGSIHI